MRKIISVICLILALFSFLPKTIFAQEHNEELLEGKIIGIESETKEDYLGDAYSYQVLQIEIYKGSLEGRVVEVENDAVSLVGVQEYSLEDRVVVAYAKDFEGNDTFYVTDYVRRSGLLYLFVLFSLMAITVGGIWGLTSLIGMAFSFLVIFKVVLPQIINGESAVIAAIMGSVLIIPVTFSLSHGIKTKTWIASLGTVITLVITGVLAATAVEMTHLTGFSSEEANFLQVQLGGEINMRGLLLAGMIISSLGVLDDITISQASIVAELKKANKKYKFPKLFSRAMIVGRDHIASLINTLILVYAGASLPLLLLFINNPLPFADVVNMEIIADEIVRTLVGSMGLILAVPITTFIAATYYQDK